MTDSQFSSTFLPYSEEALACLWPEGGWSWQDRTRTVALMKRLLDDIPAAEWPSNEEDLVILRAGEWRLDLSLLGEGQRSANLSHARDDHTAWVMEGDAGWEDFDIGGS